MLAKLLKVAGEASGIVTRTVLEVPTSMGASPAQIRPHAEASVHFHNGTFHNSEPSRTVEPSDSDQSMLTAILRRGRIGSPTGEIPLVTEPAPTDPGELAATWYGHSSVLIEVDGHRVLADPVWGKRCSPSGVVGPARMHPVPVALQTLPRVDAVIISHDHYDHLDMGTVQQLLSTQDAPFVVPVGIGAHLRIWGVPIERIVELDWNDSHQIGELSLTCTEARHFSGRGLIRNTTQWASWALSGPSRRVFFGGDTGYTSKFSEIASQYGPFDLTLLPVGAYNTQWPDIHMNPEEAVQAHLDVAAEGAVFVPIHWATFNLALHPWSEPITRLLDAAAERGVRVAVPMPGGRVDGQRPPELDRWWIAVA